MKSEQVSISVLLKNGCTSCAQKTNPYLSPSMTTFTDSTDMIMIQY